MRKRRVSKLSLSRETVRMLAGDDLRAANGGEFTSLFWSCWWQDTCGPSYPKKCKPKPINQYIE